MSFFGHCLTTLKNIAGNRSIFLTMVLSVVFYSFFYPVAYKAERPASLPIVIVDEENSPLSHKIITTTGHTPNVEVIKVTTNFADAKQLVEHSQADGILLISHNFSQSIHHGEVGGVGLYLSSAYFLRTQNIGEGLAVSLEATIKEELDKFIHIQHKPIPPLFHKTPLFNPLSGYGSYIFPAVAPLIVHQTLLLGVCMLVAGYRERQWRASLSEFLAIVSVSVMIGCLSAWYLFGFAFWWHDYPRGGNFWGMMLATPIFALCAVSVALLFASIVDCSERVGLLFIFTSIPLFMLTGLAYPLVGMPQALQSIASYLPTTQGVQLFVQLNQMGVPTTDVLAKLYYLLFVSILCLLLAFWRLHKATSPYKVLPMANNHKTNH